MEEVTAQDWQIKVVSPYAFTIGDTSGFTPYKKGGQVVQVKLPFAKSHVIHSPEDYINKFLEIVISFPF